MIKTRWQALLDRLARLSSDGDDIKEFDLQDQLIVGSSFLYMFAGIFWGLMYFALGEVRAGAIPFSYGVLISIMFLYFIFKRNVRFYISTHHLLTLLLPFFLQLELGGFVSSSAVVLWSFNSPLTAMVINQTKTARRWFIAMLFIFVLAGFLDPYIMRENNIPQTIKLILFVMNLSVVLSISFILLYYLVNQREIAYRLLNQEREKSENLLLNVLPREIADILKNESRLIADSFPEASVMFADLAGFTRLSAEMSPIEMVQLLNEVYSHYDTLVEKYGLEKIRTIGDNYMVASGVPTPRNDHAQALVSMGLEICGFAQSIRAKHGKDIWFRVGINSGPVVAGIVGQKKFHYDVWGDMVNIASRMESHGVPGRVQITKATYELIKTDFDCEPRGKIEVKGKGEMETWFVIGANGNKRKNEGE